MPQILPGVDEYLARGIQNLGEAASLFFKTDRRRERAIQDMFIQNPELMERFAALEAQAPGTLDRLRFGQAANVVRPELETAESEIARTTRPQRVRTGQVRSNIESQGMEKIAGMLSSPEGAGLSEDYARRLLDLPTKSEQAIQQRQGEVATALSNAAANFNPDEIDSIEEEVDAFISGTGDPRQAESLFAHPTYGTLAKLMYDYRVQQIQSQDTTNRVPADIRNRIAAINPARRALIEYSTAVRSFMSLPAWKRGLAVAGDPLGVLGNEKEAILQQLGNIKSMQSGLMGTFRPILSPGPLSAADIRLLNNMLASITDIRSFIRGENYVEGQLQGVNSYLENTITGLRELWPDAFPEATGLNTSRTNSTTTTTPPVGTRTGTGTTTGTGQQRSRARIKEGRTDTARAPDTRVGAGLTPRTDSVEIAGIGKISTRTLDSLGIRYNYDMNEIRAALRRGEKE